MKVFYAFLLFSAMLAVGLLTHRWGFDFKPMGPSRSKLEVKWIAPAYMADGEALDLKRMKQTQQCLDEHALLLSSAELYVDRNQRAGDETFGAPAHKQARYTVCLVLKDGTRLEARPRQADWSGLDSAMAGTVTECLAKYRELRKRHAVQGPVREIRNF